MSRSSEEKKVRREDVKKMPGGKLEGRNGRAEEGK